MDNTSVRHTAHLGFAEIDVVAWVQTGRIRFKFDGAVEELELDSGGCEDLIAILRAALADKES